MTQDNYQRTIDEARRQEQIRIQQQQEADRQAAIILAFFVWLTVKVDSDWGSPILAIITGAMALMIGFNAADLIDGQYVTTGYGLAISAALITFSLICLGWAWSMMFSKIKE